MQTPGWRVSCLFVRPIFSELLHRVHVHEILHWLRSDFFLELLELVEGVCVLYSKVFGLLFELRDDVFESVVIRRVVRLDLELVGSAGLEHKRLIIPLLGRL